MSAFARLLATTFKRCACALTALPEYRNGGLLLDTGVLALRDPADATRRHAVGSELVVEWRALTVALVDELAAHVRSRLGRPELPLACVLEGGWAAEGRGDDLLSWNLGRARATDAVAGLPFDTSGLSCGTLVSDDYRG